MADTQRIHQNLILSLQQGSGRRIYRYSHATDTLADMLASGYFDAAKLAGLPTVKGDHIIVGPENGAASPSILPITAMSGGVATVSAPDTGITFNGSGGIVDQSAELLAAANLAISLGVPLIQAGGEKIDPISAPLRYWYSIAMPSERPAKPPNSAN